MSFFIFATYSNCLLEFNMDPLTSQVYKKFAQKLGPDQIATPKALRVIDFYLLKFLKNYGPVQEVHSDPKKNKKGIGTTPGTIIEIGSGIGTITELLQIRISQINSDFKLICYETNEWCINQLSKNVSSNYTLCREISQILHSVPKNSPVFLVIDDYITNDLTQDLLNELEVKYLIIEGHRFRQRKAVARLLLANPYSIKFYGNSFDSVKGAVVFDLCEPSIKFLNIFHYFRLNLQANTYIRKFNQFCGIRKRVLLKKLVRFKRKIID